jgi:hypothetical protein
MATTSAAGLNPDGGLYSPVIFRQSIVMRAWCVFGVYVIF